ncbi:ybaK/ebsC protein [Thaumarchaeota archaeon SCGC AB-539-E09]|nr:ybaK/ebsC protein [Thaumarchaeota archaeon SCGC AB-539-E09]
MVKGKIPATNAIRFLKEKKVHFNHFFYTYQKEDVAKAAAVDVGVSAHKVVKTLIMVDEHEEPFIILMHGDMRVSTKRLARKMEKKTVRPADQKTAEKLTGYKVGGISPFGTRKELPVYVEETVLQLPTIYINGGRRGFLIEIAPSDLLKVLKPTPVNVAMQ